MGAFLSRAARLSARRLGGVLPALLLLSRASAVPAQTPVFAEPDPQTGTIELPDPGPRPSYPQAHLWRPLALDQWQVGLQADGQLGLDAGAALEPTDLIFGTTVGLLDQLQVTALLDVRVQAATGVRESNVDYALEVGATYAVFTSGTSAFSAAGVLSLWFPLQAKAGTTASLPVRSAADREQWMPVPIGEFPYVTLIPELVGVWRIARPFGLRMALSLPVTLTAEPNEVLAVTVRPEVQPVDWLWVNVGASVALANGDDLLVPLDFELGVTPWPPIDVLAAFVFPDLQGRGVEGRALTVGLRGRI